MAQSQNEVTAEVTIRENGAAYIGRKARDALGVGYNDKVELRIPDGNGGGFIRKGHLTDSAQVYIGRGIAKLFGLDPTSNNPNRDKSTHVTAVVTDEETTWEQDTDGAGKRHDGYHTLDAR